MIQIRLDFTSLTDDEYEDIMAAAARGHPDSVSVSGYTQKFPRSKINGLPAKPLKKNTRKTLRKAVTTEPAKPLKRLRKA